MGQQQQEARAHANRSGMPPRVPPTVPPVTGGTQTKQHTPPNQRSALHRATKPAGVAFGIAAFTFSLIHYTLPTPELSFGARMFALFYGLFAGLLPATLAYWVAVAFYARKTDPKGAVEPDGSKAGKKPRNLVLVGIIIGVLCAMGVSKQGRNALSFLFSEQGRDERNPASQLGASLRWRYKRA